MKHFTERQKGIVSLVLLALVYASMGLFVRYLAGFTLLQQVYLRALSALIIGGLFFYKYIRPNKIAKLQLKEWILLLVRGTAFYLFGVSLFSEAILLTKYSNVSFISAIPLTAILGFILIREKFNIKKVLYILLAFIGVVLISVQDFSNIFSWGRGELAILASSFFFAFGYVSRKWHSKLLNNQEITQLVILFGFLFTFLTSLFVDRALPTEGFTTFIVIIIVLAGIANVLNGFLTSYGFEKVEPVLGSNLLSLEALFAIIIALFFFKEIPTIKELFGGVIILFAVFQMNKIEEKN